MTKLAEHITESLQSAIDDAVAEALQEHLEPYAVEDSNGNNLNYESRVDSDGDLFITVTLDTEDLDDANERIKELKAEVNELNDEIADLKEELANLRNAD